MDRLVWLYFVWWLRLDCAQAWLSSIPNLRPVVEGMNLYRSAALDQVSIEDAQQLVHYHNNNKNNKHNKNTNTNTTSSTRITLIDLRNADEREGTTLSQGAQWLYKDYLPQQNNTNHPTILEWIPIPILQDTNRFWDAAIDRLDASTRWQATISTIWQGGALDRAAAQHLQEGGHAALYTIMLDTAQVPIAQALNVCIKRMIMNEQADHIDDDNNTNRIVLFHCQKGKDRTGLVAALLQHILGCDREQIIADYALTEQLLDESSEDKKKSKSSTNSGGLIDWSFFRGSPPSAMRETLDWIDQRYGSVDAYLESLAVLDKDAMKEFQKKYRTTRTEEARI